MEGYIESKRHPESDETQRDDTKKNKRKEKKEVENDFEERRVETNGNEQTSFEILFFLIESQPSPQRIEFLKIFCELILPDRISTAIMKFINEL